MRHLYVTLIALIISFSFTKAYGQVVGPILGNPAMCSPSYMTYLSDTTAGGVWSSSSAGVATVGSSGIVTGIIAGTAIITYTVGSISSTLVVTVNVATPGITGGNVMCAGLSTTLSDAAGGGTWSAINTTASVSSSGIVTGGTAPGIDTIIYTLGTGCSTSIAVTVNADPPLPSGLTVCMGSTITLTDGLTGASWSSGNTGIAMVTSTFGTIIITGVSFGTATIYETLSTGCASSTVVTVNATPTAITGLTHICAGICTTLTSSPAGGIWSGTGVVVAIGSVTGVACAVATGISTVTYTIANGCFATTVITVNPNPGPMEGSMTVCLGLTTGLTDASTGGTWTEGCLASVATITGSTGVVEGVSAGTCVITYTLPTGCITTAVVTVVATAPPPTGPTNVCVGNTFTLSDAITPGTWSSSDYTIVSVGSASGILLANAAGTATITYTVFTGCVSSIVVTVNATVAPILGTNTLCVGSSTTFSDATGGGTWSSSNSSIGSVDAVSSVITGVASGVTTISYVLSAGCVATTQLTVNILSPILGSTSLCDGGSITLSDATGGGAWSSSSTTIATISSSGTVSGVGSGVTIISYAFGTGCVALSAVTVNAAPGAIGGIAGALCLGSTAVLTDATTGGTWNSSNTSIATVGLASGIVVGGAVVTAVTCTITYTLSTGCMSTAVITVNPSPAAILVTTSLCVGSGITLSDGTTGGTWSTTSTVIAVNTTTGVVTSTAAGTATITYTAATGCYTTIVITADNTPAITGAGPVCAGSSITLADGTGGGTWSSSVTSIATVGATTGVVSGVSGGVSTISYQVGGCYATADVTVNAAPAGITGGTYVCAGSILTLNDAATGGTWSSSVTSVAAIGSSTGVVTGIAGGSTDITYDLGTGCFATAAISVNALPTITATSTSNCGGIYDVSASGSGTGGSYVWMPVTGLSCATCNSTTASISSTVTYSVTGTDVNGCANTYTVTLNGNRISGYMTMTTTPTDTVKVWLIQFNSTDSSLTAEDSTLSCMDGGTPYYEFDNEPAGNYMVKAMLRGGVAGTSGYIPTYGLSTSHWDTAIHIVHVSATDTQHINMIYGTVPTGPGFIGGLITSGAGRGTASGVPVAGMLVYLEDGSGNILTYTYTNTSGIYSFSGLAYNNYRVYPEDYQYHTTPWISITLSATSDSVASADFYQNTTSHTIIPGNNLHTTQIVGTAKIGVYPNPATNELNVNWTNEQTGKAQISITDVTGRKVFESGLDMTATSGNALLDISNINSGIYFILIKSEGISYTSKLLIQR